MFYMNFNRMLKYIGISAISAFMAIVSSCSDDMAVVSNQGIDDGSVTVSLAIPDMVRQDTRAFGNSNTPQSGLKLTVFEFAMGSDATNTFPTRTYQAETLTNTNVENGGIVNFKIPNLIKTNEPRVLHFVVAPDYLTIPYGAEAAVFESLSVSNGTQAYWARLEFPNGYAQASADTQPGETPEMIITDETKSKFQNIPVVRNFAKVSMEMNPYIANKFQLYGFELVNVPNAGTVAPYNIKTKSFASLTKADGNMNTYDDIIKEYQGIMPASARFYNTETEAKNWTTDAGGNHPFKIDDKFFYEHPFESTRRTYVLVWGSYLATNPDTGQQYWTRNSYYKVDLGQLDETTQIFDYYQCLVRNIDYHITINDVTSAGYATPSEAIGGVTYNNISADVDTRNMLSISDGANMISVNRTTFVITEEKPFDFYYQYTTGVGGNNKGNGNNLANFKAEGLVPGDVIASVTTPEEVTYQGEKWMKVTITPTEVIGGEGKKQQFIIIDGAGLGREITLISHVPYDYSEKKVYAGSDNEYPAGVTEGTVSPEAGQAFTVYFNLPPGMPEEIFPLEFVLESNRQNMENNPIGTLAVTTGETLFPTTVTYTEPTVKYVKTVSYQEYLHKYDAGTNEVDPNSENTQHLVRCRFRTINALKDLPGNPASTTTYVLVYNDYFNCKTTSTDPAQWPGVVTFTRTQ